MVKTTLPMDFYYESAPEAHKKKQRQKARELRATQWWKRLINEGICYYCGEKFAKEVLTMDHKVPIARGGMSTKTNIVVSCKECNTKKKHFTPAEMTDLG